MELPRIGGAQNSYFTRKGSLKGLQLLPNLAWAQVKIDALNTPDNGCRHIPPIPLPACAAPAIPLQGWILHGFSHKVGEEQQVQSVKTRGCQLLSSKTFPGLQRKPLAVINTDPPGILLTQTVTMTEISTGILGVTAPGESDRYRVPPELRLMLPSVTTPNSLGCGAGREQWSPTDGKILCPQDTLWRFYYIECKMQLSVK